jgi:hypothetical protein
MRAEWLVLIALLVGCSTGPYLRPEALTGTYSTENPACPGAQEALDLPATPYDWITFRVLAKLPDHNGNGTRLVAYFRFDYLKPPPPREAWGFFADDERERLVQERRALDILITYSGSSATVVEDNGTKTQVVLPFFEKSFNHKIDKWYGIWGPEVLISQKSLNNFTVILPDAFINGTRIQLPPVTFRVHEETYAPVLNC